MTTTTKTSTHIYSVTPKNSWGPVLMGINPEDNTVMWVQIGPGTEFQRFYISDEEIPFDPSLYTEVVRLA